MDLPDENCELPAVNAAPRELEGLLRAAKTIAIVGLSPNPGRPSHGVARYLQARGYRIVPVRPGAAEILGEKCYASLEEIPFPVDIVDVFRRSEHIPALADAAVRIKAKALWLQEGVVHNPAARRAREAGLIVAQNLCILKVHAASSLGRG